MSALSDVNSTWIVVPAYNEGAVIGETLAGLKLSFQNIVIVDDHSTDMTAQIAIAIR